MASIFTPREFKNYCYVVKCEDGNGYDVGVFMTFEGLKKYFKKIEWKFNKNITEDKFIKMFKVACFIIYMMEIID